MPMVENPAWVTRVIADNYEFLEDRVPPAWLPLLSKPTASHRGKRMSAAMSEYGCGAYGCVLPTLSPDTVLKVTTDQSEANFAVGLADTLVAPIVVEYRMAMSLSAQHDGLPIWLLWRESAEHVGGLLEVLGKRAGERAEIAVHDQHVIAQQLVEDIVKRHAKPSLVAYKDSLHKMRALPELAEFARGMLDVLEQQHILIGDVHGGNLGTVGGKWKIVDPGHVLVLEGMRENPTVDGFSFSRIEAPLLRNTQSGRMLRLLWDRGRMTQAEFMKRSSHIGGDLDEPLRPTRGTGLSSFANNYAHFTRPYAVRRLQPQPPHGTLDKVAKFVAPVAQRPTSDADIAEGYAQNKRSIMLVWTGPTPAQWIAALSDVELKKAGERMREAVLDGGNDVDFKWVLRLAAETARRTGETVAFDRWFEARSATESRELLAKGDRLLAADNLTLYQWLDNRSDVELEQLFALADRLITAGNPIGDAFLTDIATARARKGVGTADHRRVLKNNPSVPFEEALKTAQTLLRDPSPGTLTVLQDMALEHGDLEDFLFRMSTRDDGEEVPDTADDLEHGDFTGLPPPDQRVREGVRGPFKERVSLQWRLTGYQRASTAGLEWVPRLTIIAPLEVPSSKSPHNWDIPLILSLQMPGKSWIVMPDERTSRRPLPYGEARHLLMQACWLAINMLRPDEWQNYLDDEHYGDARGHANVFLKLFAGSLSSEER